MALEQHCLLDLVSQYEILSLLASELTLDDLVNLGCTSSFIWSCINSAVEKRKLATSISSKAVTCRGQKMVITPNICSGMEVTYTSPCKKKRSDQIRKCDGCGIGVCDTCRFKIDHGTVVQLSHRKNWFFPSRTRSSSVLVKNNIEHLVSSYIKHGHDYHKSGKSPCPCTYQDRWLDRWLCVPCLNEELYGPREAIKRVPPSRKGSIIIDDAEIEVAI